jgi:hypothetical protein
MVNSLACLKGACAPPSTASSSRVTMRARQTLTAAFPQTRWLMTRLDHQVYFWRKVK